MENLREFPKIFQVGDRHIPQLFDGYVEITEKVDGSQFVFAINPHTHELMMRSKGAVIDPDDPPKMFAGAVAHVISLRETLWSNYPGWVFYCEAMESPHHNKLVYDRIPRNHLYLFGVELRDPETGAKCFLGSECLRDLAEELCIEPPRILYEGLGTETKGIMDYLDQDSVLGGTKIEGFVVKNYTQISWVGGHDYPITSAKIVSPKFKEKMNQKHHHTKDHLEVLSATYRTVPRWEKAVQHLRESGKLAGEPADIGLLIREVHRDILEEEGENIKDELLSIYGKKLLGGTTIGLPEWYKQQLTESGLAAIAQAETT